MIEVQHPARRLCLQVAEAVHRAVEILRRDAPIGTFEQHDRFGAGPGKAGETGEYEKDFMPAIVERALDQVDLDAA